jgi:MFS family permease
MRGRRKTPPGGAFVSRGLVTASSRGGQGMETSRSTAVRRLLRAALCGMVCGTFGPVVLFLLLAWQGGQDALRLLGFFAALAALYGALPGLLNGLIGSLNGLWVGRRRGGWPVEFVPLVMVVLAWVWDRGDPKVGLTLLCSLIPAAFTWAAGFVGQVIGSGGREAKAEVVDVRAERGTAADRPRD